MAVVHLGNAVFIDKTPITPADWRGERRLRKRWGTPTQRAIEWLDEAMARGEKVSINPWVEFPSLERAYVGVALMMDGQVRDTITLKEVPYFEPMAPYLPYDLIDSELKDAKPWMFEEMGWVEVRDKDDWESLLEAHKTAYKKEDEDDRYEYDGPGLYDGRDMTKAYDSVEDYEESVLEDQATELIDYMFSGGLLASDLKGDEWAKAFEKLALEAAEESGEEYEEESD